MRCPVFGRTAGRQRSRSRHDATAPTHYPARIALPSQPPNIPMRLALVQRNVTLGDFDAIDATIVSCARQAQAENAELVVFSDRFLIGGPAGAFAVRQETLAHCNERLQRLAHTLADGPAVLIGTPVARTDDFGKTAYNGAALLHQGEVQIVHHQQAVAGFGVKQDRAHFEPDNTSAPFTLKGQKIGIAIGNDLWNESDIWQRPDLRDAPAAAMAASCNLLIHLDADPWYPERPAERAEAIQTIARAHECAIVSVNHIGSAQSVLFDGRSMVINAAGDIQALSRTFEDDLLLFDTAQPSKLEHGEEILQQDSVDGVLDALIFGLRDNVLKSGFTDVVLGLSGGIDSAIVAAIAVEALGEDHVHGVALPSRYSSDHSLRDAKDLADALNISYQVVSIEPVHEALMQTMGPLFEGTEEGTAEENLQARARGVILMGLSNKFNQLLLATSNKSEFAVGYCTLYGDMNGAFSPLTDVPKEMVYAISYRFNERRGHDVIPISTLTKPPSAELRPGQTDQDSLPEYAVLDEIIDRYVVREQSAEEIVAAGFDPADVRRVVWLINLNGYKRQQAAPGLRVSRQALAIGRDFPNIGNFSSLNLPADKA